MLALLSVVLAAPLQLVTSPEAQVQLLPMVQPGRSEIIVYDNHVNLRVQIKDKQFDGIRRIWATDLGDIWVVNVILENLNTSLDVVREETNWKLSPRFNPQQDSLAVQAISLSEIAAGAVYPNCTHSALTISPLVRSDMTYAVDPADFVPLLARWSDAEPVASSWEDVSSVRALLSGTAQVHGSEGMPEARGAGEHSVALPALGGKAALLYRLAALHRNLGHAREAAYYFQEARQYNQEKALATIQYAGSLFDARELDQAEAAAWEAWRAGAPEESVVELLAGIAVARQKPDAAIALSLAHTTARPASLLLSGALLVQAGCPQEAIPVLEKSVRYLRRTDVRRATEGRMLLVDAYLLSGKMDEAEKMLSQLHESDVSKDWAGILRARSKLLTLLRQTPDAWSSMIPTLNQFRSSLTPEGDESLYLLGQIQEWLGDDRTAIETWLLLLDHNRHLAQGQPGQKLTQAWMRRAQKLMEEEKTMEAMALHTTVWRPFMADLIKDPQDLKPLAQAYLDLGLYTQAMRLLGVIADIEGREKLDDQKTILTIAQTYLGMGHPDLARDAIAVLSTRTLSSEISGQMWILNGLIAEAEGKHEDALAAWRQALAYPETALEAEGRLARTAALNAQCTEALPSLQRVLENAEVRTRLGEGSLRSLYAWCLDQDKNPEGSTVEAYLATKALKDDNSRRFVSYLSEKAATQAKVPQPGGPSRPTDPDIWTLLGDEEKAHVQFVERVNASAK